MSRLITVPIHRLAHAPEELPQYATTGSAGMDVRAAITQAITLQPFERQLIPTGLIVLLPKGYECQIRPRSGLSIKHGITLINCVGTVDSDYRDEVKVPLVNLSQQAFTVEPGERIAQLVIAPVTQAVWEDVSLDWVTRSKALLDRQGGFGSTGRV
ncbi:MAG: dUTP diphosphatase [Vampirovibrionales bacterium]